MKITNPYSNLTKKDSETMERMSIFRKHERLMKDARSDKENYLNCKSKNTLNLDEKNRVALSQLISTFKENALENWNKAQDLRREYTFLNEMIKLKK
jgi:hypothetical protein